MNSCPESAAITRDALPHDLRQAIEEVYQPIEQAIAPETAAKVASGIAPFRMDALYLYTYSDVQWQTLRAPDQDRVPGGSSLQSLPGVICSTLRQLADST
jgi:hypothetical protein